jgi:branched-chain amino acid transport system ATP-binding protein
VALLGTNGAGKSTLLRVAAGLVEPTSGTVRIDGRDVTTLRPDERVGCGLVLVEGGRATFPSLTVRENLLMGAYPHLGDRGLVAERLADVLELFPALAGRLEQAAGTLSGGEQQMMAVGRALMAGSDLLLVDELSLGLAPVVLQEIVRVLAELARRGVTLLIVEQSLNVALRVAEHAYFMEKGEIRFSGPISKLVKRGDLVRSVFFGKQAARV